MKNLTYLFVLLIVVLLNACSGSDAYQGEWKAMNEMGNKFEITFSPKSFSVKDSLGNVKEVGYTQNSIKIENSITTYGIKLNNGISYHITFPNNDDEDIAVFTDANRRIYYTLGRKKYVTYDDIYNPVQ